MNNKIHVLHLLRQGEKEPPENLSQAAAVRTLPAGCEPDQSTREWSPQVLSLRGPLDHDTARVIERLRELKLPVLAFADSISQEVNAHVTEETSARDLSEMLSLLDQLNRVEALIENAGESRVEETLSRLTDNLVAMTEHFMALRMPDYHQRAERVYQACQWIGGHLPLKDEERRALSYAARLREIGKLGLPDKILFTSRKERTPQEQAIYDRYPTLGARVLKDLPTLAIAARYVEYQLENYDGSGPSRLSSEQIPLGSRILRVAGASEMIVSENSEVDSAISVLEKGQGSLYDPFLVKLAANYHKLTSAQTSGQSTRRVRLTDLEIGMVLAEDLWSRDGMKILPEGTQLTERTLKILHSIPMDRNLEAIEVHKS